MALAISRKEHMNQDLDHLRTLYHRSLPEVLDQIGFGRESAYLRDFDVSSKVVLRRALHYLGKVDERLIRFSSQISPLTLQQGRVKADAANRLGQIQAVHSMIRAVVGSTQLALSGKSLLN